MLQSEIVVHNHYGAAICHFLEIDVVLCSLNLPFPLPRCASHGKSAGCVGDGRQRPYHAENTRPITEAKLKGTPKLRIFL